MLLKTNVFKNSFVLVTLRMLGISRIVPNVPPCYSMLNVRIQLKPTVLMTDSQIWDRVTVSRKSSYRSELQGNAWQFMVLV